MTEPDGPTLDDVGAAIRGAPDVWRRLTGADERSAFIEAAALHRVRPLLAWRLRRAGELDSWPADIRRALTDAERAEAALEIVRREQLCAVLHAFQSAQRPVLLIKGAALAYTIYPEPWLRPREDTDLLIRHADLEQADRVLRSCGYRQAVRQSGRLVSHQRLYVRSDAGGRRDAYDLHWKIANPAAFADLLSADDLLRDAPRVSIADRCDARVPSPAHSLLLACWHRVSHHYDRDDLLWLYDVHLLTERLTTEETARVIDVARRTRTGAICARGIRLAGERVAARPPVLAAELDRLGGPALPAMAYLSRDARPVDRLVADLRALPGWGSRARLVGEHLFPPAAYMHETYGRSSRLLLPALYLWRIVSGARRWLRRPRDPVA